jgi:hypothetical protein
MDPAGDPLQAGRRGDERLWEARVEEYAHQQNVARFREELTSERDPARRALLERLLKEEQRQLDRIQCERADL